MTNEGQDVSARYGVIDPAFGHLLSQPFHYNCMRILNLSGADLTKQGVLYHVTIFDELASKAVWLEFLNLSSCNLPSFPEIKQKNLRFLFLHNNKLNSDYSIQNACKVSENLVWLTVMGNPWIPSSGICGRPGEGPVLDSDPVKYRRQVLLHWLLADESMM